MKKSEKILLWILAMIIVLILGYVSYIYFNNKNETSKFSGQYRDLAKQCSSKNSYSCCMDSVQTMSDNSYNQTENTCPAGYISNTLKCEDSFTWCEPKK